MNGSRGAWAHGSSRDLDGIRAADHILSSPHRTDKPSEVVIHIHILIKPENIHLFNKFDDH